MAGDLTKRRVNEIKFAHCILLNFDEEETNSFLKYHMYLSIKLKNKILALSFMKNKAKIKFLVLLVETFKCEILKQKLFLKSHQNNFKFLLSISVSLPPLSFCCDCLRINTILNDLLYPDT